MTLRELAWARQGKEFSDLEKLAEHMALLANIHRDQKKSRVIRGWDIWHRPGSPRPSRHSLTVDVLHGMRPMFTKGA